MALGGGVGWGVCGPCAVVGGGVGAGKEEEEEEGVVLEWWEDGASLLVGEGGLKTCFPLCLVLFAFLVFALVLGPPPSVEDSTARCFPRFVYRCFFACFVVFFTSACVIPW